MLSSLSEMSVEQLKNAVEQEIRKPAPNRTTVMECLQELKRRESDDVPDKVLEAWELSQQPKVRPVVTGWHRIIAVAAIVAVVLLVTIPDVCGEENVIQLIGRWTKDIFSFGEIREREFVYQTDHPGLQELYDTVTALGAERNVVPTWIPDGYELEQIEVNTKSDKTTVFANFSDKEHYIVINIMIFNQIRNSEYQKGIEAAETYEKDGIKHYIVENDLTWTVAWSNNNIECSMSAYNKENLYKMISSIY